MDATYEIDIGMTAEEPDIGVFDVGGIGVRSGQNRVVGLRRAIPDALFEASDVVANGYLEGVDFAGGEKQRDLINGARVELLVGVENENPIGRDCIESEIAGGGEVVIPGDRDDMSAEGRSDGNSVVSRTGVSEDDLIDDATDAGQTGGEQGRGVLGNHGQREGGHMASA